jgi:hypothetical protein
MRAKSEFNGHDLIYIDNKEEQGFVLTIAAPLHRPAVRGRRRAVSVGVTRYVSFFSSVRSG